MQRTPTTSTPSTIPTPRLSACSPKAIADAEAKLARQQIAGTIPAKDKQRIDEIAATVQTGMSKSELVGRLIIEGLKHVKVEQRQVTMGVLCFDGEPVGSMKAAVR